jgi:hypothetical protein
MEKSCSEEAGQWAETETFSEPKTAVQDEGADQMD